MKKLNVIFLSTIVLLSSGLLIFANLNRDNVIPVDQPLLGGATVYASAAGGNWSSDLGTWVTTSGGSTIANHPVAGDTVILDANSGAVTVNVASACTTLSAADYASTLALGTQTLTVSGNITLGAAGHISISTGGLLGHDFIVAGHIVCSSASVINCSGSWNVSLFTMSTSTITFSSTSAGETITCNAQTFYGVTWNGSGGEWTLQDNLSQSRGTAFTAGTLILNGKTYTSTRTATMSMTSGFILTVGNGYLSMIYTTMTIGNGCTVTIGTSGSWQTAGLIVSGTGTFACTGNSTVVVAGGNVAISSANFDCGTSTFIIQNATSDTINCSRPLYNFEIGRATSGTNDVTTLAADLTVLNNFAVVARATYSRAFHLNTFTMTVGGNFTNGDTFDCDTGTIVLNDNTKTSTIGGTVNTTFNILQCLTGGKTVLFKQDSVTTVASLDFTGADGSLITINTDTSSGHAHLSDSAGTNQVEYCDIHNSIAEGGATWNAFTSDGNVDGGGNTWWVFSGAVATFNSLMLSGD